ncbi:TPA: hypothetical protein ACNTD2_004765, partial [Escherichia coli]
ARAFFLRPCDADSCHLVARRSLPPRIARSSKKNPPPQRQRDQNRAHPHARGLCVVKFFSVLDIAIKGRKSPRRKDLKRI